NVDLARQHTEAVVAAAPNAAVGYEMRAMIAQRDKSREAERAALDQAIEHGSKDAAVYTRRGQLHIDDAAGQSAPCDRVLPSAPPRPADDLCEPAIALRPRDRDSYEGLMLALLNVSSATEQDDAALAIGRQALPTDGTVVVAQAALERSRGNVPQAAKLIAVA